ncbi:type II toxin-antitoxin system RelE/ParE family toxin [Lacibacterium aquatile]|uniref:Type II toxin-antitoxin system RelE/ParE family toxin n=1 Tax=Lacibacterium aquatile TaxID=1168082 RepID=A0ABW5DPC0_9PROT
MRVVWTGPAVKDIAAHSAYLNQVNPLAAQALAIALFTAGDSLAALPLRGRVGRLADTRELLAVSPYVIVYEVGVDAVTILRIWHGSLLA